MKVSVGFRPHALFVFKTMPTFAVRGATAADTNTESAILAAARELLTEITRVNRLVPGELVSVFFTMTADLDAAFPTRAAREMGWTHVALLDALEPQVRGDLQRCLRVLIHFNREDGGLVRHVYLGAARTLRPDLDSNKEENS